MGAAATAGTCVCTFGDRTQAVEEKFVEEIIIISKKRNMEELWLK